MQKLSKVIGCHIYIAIDIVQVSNSRNVRISLIHTLNRELVDFKNSVIFCHLYIDSIVLYKEVATNLTTNNS